MTECAWDLPLNFGVIDLHSAPYLGRQARVFARSIFNTELRKQWIAVGAKTYGDAFEMAKRDFGHLGKTELRIPFGYNTENGIVTEIPRDAGPTYSNPQLHPYLHDLARMIRWDLSEACGAFDNPDFEYPGVDRGIPPVSDDHAALVIWGTQRELDRETRNNLPAAPLAELPWRVQRAFAERRRLRYQEWGIGQAQWEANEWSVFDVPDDRDWAPPWPVSAASTAANDQIVGWWL